LEEAMRAPSFFIIWGCDLAKLRLAMFALGIGFFFKIGEIAKLIFRLSQKMLLLLLEAISS
jgi:hypothetical protein